ncbi:MAG TPA: hypothetical protein VE826_05470 [Dongiaceae bacterium]|nr:hypothetical protein [Dongiaceae bacterium]
MRVFVAFLCCLVTSFGAFAAAGAADALVVRVAVVDGDGRPQAAAAVFAKDAAGDTLLGSTADDGTVSVSTARGTQLYARLGSLQSAPAAVTAPAMRIVIGLPTIGAVTARAPLGSVSVSARSAAAIVGGDLTNALAFVPNYRTEAEGGSGAVQIDGTPVMLPSSLGGTGRFSIPSSLVASFSPDQADDGTVSPNLHLNAPTATPQRNFTFGIGSQGLVSLQTVFTGRLKKLGYAVALADQGTGGKLAGLTFRDASGLAYDHATRAHQLDASVNLDYTVGTARVNLVALGSRSSGARIGSVLPGTLAEGFGPGNTQATSFGTGYLRVSQTRGRDSWAFLDVRFAGSATDDDRAAMTALAPIPSYSGYRFAGHYDELSATRAFGRDSATLKLSSTVSDVAGFNAGEESVSKSSGTTLALILARNGPSSSLSATVSAARQTGPFSAAHADVTVKGARWGPRSRVDWSVYSAQAQLMETYYADALRLAVPGAADFDCAGRSAFASGPSRVTEAAPHVVAAKVNVTRQLGARSQISAGGFYAQTTNALVMAADSGGVALPAGYTGALGNGFANACGGAALSPQNVFLTHYASVPRRVGAEWYASGSTALGPTVVTAGYETYSVYATGVTPSPASTLIDHAQLWNVPLHRASLLIAYPRPALTAAVGFTYVSANNAAHLPAHLTASAGIRAVLGNGVVTLSGQNLFGSYAGVFTSSRFSAPTATTGAPVSFLATPVTPTWTLRYELHGARQRNRLQ